MATSFIRKPAAAALLLAALLPGGSPHAQNVQSAGRMSAMADMRFEGVWARPGSVTLLKQFPKHLVLQGKDEASVWSARCVLAEGKAQCSGNGFTITGYEFIYESTLSIEPQGLRDVWRAVFPDAQNLSGNDLLQPVPLPAFQPARR